MRKVALLVALAAIILPGCSDDGTPGTPDQGQTVLDKGVGGKDAGPDGVSQKDGTLQPDQQVTSPDQAVAQPDQGAPAQKSILQVVANKLTLPKSGTDFTADLDGTGKKNQLGHIIGALSMTGGALDPQSDLDSMISSGYILLLFDVIARSLTKDLNMRVDFYMGKDTDSNPNNNFTGSATLAVDKTVSPSALKLNGSIGAKTSGELSVGPGSLIIPVPFGSTPINMTLKKAQLETDISTTGMSNGQINGAIPMSDVNTKLLPAVASLMDSYCKSTGNAVVCGFDSDKDGTITAKDLQNNGLIGLLIKADVDTDGDKKEDAMSVGMGFTATTCTITK